MEKIKKLYLGKYEDHEVFWDLDSSPNKHVALIGSSGGGKSVTAQQIICRIAEQGGTVFVIDYHGILSEDQIFPPLKDTFDKYRNDIDAYIDGIPVNFFNPLTYPDGYVEDPDDTAGGVANILYRAITTGGNNLNQRTILRYACEQVMKSNSYSTLGFKAIQETLLRSSDKVSLIIEERMHPIFSRNIFKDGDGLILPGRINIVHLSKMDLGMQHMIAEILLSYLWRLGNADQFKASNLFVFIDEAQNLSANSNGVLPDIISEGRKMGINLLLATQLVPLATQNLIMQRIPQCGLMLYFKPSANRANQTAKMLNSSDDPGWRMKLALLNPGEFIASGNLLVDSIKVNYPLQVDSRIQMDTITKDGNAEKIKVSNNPLRL